MEPLTRLLNQARAFWGGLSGVRRVLIVGAAVAVLIGLGAFAYLNQPGDGVPLFAERLPEDEVAAITTALKAQSIPYVLSDSNTVRVPKERLAAARVALAAEGLPARGGGKGLEFFETSNITRTPGELRINYVRALQVELARSIMHIESVAAARVMIALPDPTPFIRDQRPATASVVLKLKPTATFNRANATSVVQLVSRSVDGLKPENVTVVDSTGRLLSDPRAGEKDDLSPGMMDQRRDLEQYLAQKAQDMLTAHLGPGRAVVQVSADLNYQKVKELQTSYPKDGAVVRAERNATSKSTNAGRSGGVAGAVPNVRPAAATGGGGGGGNSSEEVNQADYDTSRLVREMEERMGAVTRLTVAALVDLTPLPAAEGQSSSPTPITAADAEAIIQNAIGFRTGRDSVKVVNGHLGGPPPTVNEPDEETLRIQRMTSYVELARNISLAVAVAMVVAVIGLFFIRRRARPAAGPAGAAEAAAATPEQRRQELLERFIETARSDPARTAGAFGLLLGPPGG